MKKLGFCLLALCLMGYVTGCGNEDTAPADPAAPADTTPADPAAPADTTEGEEADPPA